MGEIPQEQDPNILKNTKISLEEIPNNKTEGQTLEQEEKESLIKRVSELAAKVEGGINLKPGEEILWKIRLRVKMTPKQQSALIEKRRSKYIFGRPDLSSEHYGIENLIQDKIISLSPAEKKKVSGLSYSENLSWGDEIIKKLLSEECGNFQRACINAAAERTVKKDEDGHTLSIGNIEMRYNDDNVFLNGGEKMSKNDAVDFITKRLNGE